MRLKPTSIDGPLLSRYPQIVEGGVAISTKMIQVFTTTILYRKVCQPAFLQSSVVSEARESVKRSGTSAKLQCSCRRKLGSGPTVWKPNAYSTSTPIDPLKSSIQMSSHQRDFQCRSLCLNSEMADRSLSSKEKMRSAFCPGSLPISTFRIWMRAPTSGVVEHRLPIAIGITHDLEKSTAEHLPLNVLNSFTAYIMDFTSIHCIREEIKPEGGDTIFAHVEETVLIKHIGDAPIPERLDLQDLVRFVIPKHKVPTFITFNISRVYSLKVKLEFECAKENYKTKLIVPGFRILSQH